jgi:hypothetical protein
LKLRLKNSEKFIFCLKRNLNLNDQSNYINTESKYGKNEMTRCPECDDGDMEFDPKIRKYVCQSCGIALTKSEIDDDWDDIRFGHEDPVEKKKKEQEEYRKWMFQKKSTKK